MKKGQKLPLKIYTFTISGNTNKDSMRVIYTAGKTTRGIKWNVLDRKKTEQIRKYIIKQITL